MSPQRACFVSILLLVPTLTSGVEWPDPAWSTSTPAAQSMNATELQKARDFALRGGGSGMIIRHGFLVYSWGSLTTRYDVKSTTKSFGATALGLGVQDGRVALSGRAQTYFSSFGVPPSSNTATGWLDDITLLHLATHSAGFDKTGAESALLFQPGTKWGYSDGGPNWLADVLTMRYRQDLFTLMRARVFTPLSIGTTELTWRSNAYRSDTLDGVKRREFGSGISCSVNAMARLGLLYLRSGVWRGTRLIPSSYVFQVRTVPSAIKGLPVTNPTQYPSASSHYGLLWWNNADGRMASVPRDTYWAWGLYDSLIVVIPSLDIVAARAGSTIRTMSATDPRGIEPFIGPIAKSTLSSTTSAATAVAPADESEAEPDDAVSAPRIQTLGNAPPKVNAGGSHTLTLPANTLTLSGSVADHSVPGGQLSVAWRDLNGMGAIFSAAENPRTSVTFPRAGTYVLELRADDGELTATDEAIITVIDPATYRGTLRATAIGHARRTTWVGFTLPGLPPADGIATLRVPVDNVVAPGEIEVHQVLAQWDTRSLANGPLPGVDATALAHYSVAEDDTGLVIELDVTGAVSRWSPVDAAKGLAIINVSGDVSIAHRSADIGIRLD